MKIDRNDPRLTAYVLNELSAEDRKLIEAAISADPELAKEVAGLKQATGVLFSELNSQAHRLDQERREKIFSQLPKESSWFDKYWKVSAGLVTASIAFVIFTSNRSAMMSKATGSRSDHLVADSADTSTSNSFYAKKREGAPPPARPAAAPSEVAASAREGKDSAAEVRERAMPSEQKALPESAGAAVADAEIEIAAPAPKKSSAAVRDELAKTAADSAPSGFAPAAGSGGAAAPSQAAPEMKAEDAKARSAVALKTKMFTSSRAKSAEISAASAQASANYNISFTSNNDESKKAEEKLQRIFLPKLKMCISEHTLKYGHYSVSMTLDWQVLNSKVVNFKVKRLSVPKEDIADLLTCFETQIVEFAAAAAVPSQTDTAFSFDVSFEK